MVSPRTGTGTPLRLRRAGPYRRLAFWTGLSFGWILTTTGCQVEYAGMTLPSGKYMHDDVQYFPPGPAFPWANTQAATQRARMQMLGIEPAPGQAAPGSVPNAPGMINPLQNRLGRPTDVSASPLSVEPPTNVEGAPAPPPAPGIPGPEGLPAPGGAPGVGAPGGAGEANAPPGPMNGPL
jgi:hypothetical protein